MLLALLVLYFLICFLLPTFRVYKNTGKNPITFKNADNAHDLIGFYMKVVMGLCVVAGLEQLQPSYFNFYVFFDTTNTTIYGYSLMIISMMWTAVAQLQMSNSWRIGIDNENTTDLRHQGLFRFSRNPIFLGMIGLVLGIFIVRPIFLNMLTFVLSVILISIQVRLEEEFLHRQHGETYSHYKARTRRWI